MCSSWALFYLDWVFKIPEELVWRSLSLWGENQAWTRLLIEEAGGRPRQHPQKFLIVSLALPCRVGFQWSSPSSSLDVLSPKAIACFQILCEGLACSLVTHPNAKIEGVGSAAVGMGKNIIAYFCCLSWQNMYAA